MQKNVQSLWQIYVWVMFCKIKCRSQARPGIYDNVYHNQHTQLIRQLEKASDSLWRRSRKVKAQGSGSNNRLSTYPLSIKQLVLEFLVWKTDTPETGECQKSERTSLRIFREDLSSFLESLSHCHLRVASLTIATSEPQHHKRSSTVCAAPSCEDARAPGSAWRKPRSPVSMPLSTSSE